MDLNKIPKQFCENVHMGYSKEAFMLALISGQNIAAFALTPQHAKRLLLSLEYNLQEFEKNFGEIKTEWMPGVQSPIQMIDLNKPKSDK